MLTLLDNNYIYSWVTVTGGIKLKFKSEQHHMNLSTYQQHQIKRILNEMVTYIVEVKPVWILGSVGQTW